MIFFCLAEAGVRPQIMKYTWATVIGDAAETEIL